MISVVVNSYNEDRWLDNCLASVVGFADEIVVVDMHSTDNTVEIAKKYNAKIYQHPQLDYVEPVRRFAVEKAKYDWVMILDPDEEMSTNLKTELKKIANSNEFSAVNIPRLNNIFGANIKHSNFWPDYQIRFVKKDRVEFSDQIHSYPSINGEIKKIAPDEKFALRHTPYTKISEYWQKIDRYSTIESQNRWAAGEKYGFWKFLTLAMMDFVRRYVYHFGFLDGWRGFMLAYLQFRYYLLVGEKLKKLK